MEKEGPDFPIMTRGQPEGPGACPQPMFGEVFELT
jgi:hypothetical protein